MKLTNRYRLKGELKSVNGCTASKATHDAQNIKNHQNKIKKRVELERIFAEPLRVTLPSTPPNNPPSIYDDFLNSHHN